MTRTETLSDIVDMSIPPVRDIPNSLVIYTDGSWAEDEPYAGVGVYIPHLKLRFSARLTGPRTEQNIDRAEIQAAVSALKIAAHYRGRFPSITLRTDSLNLLYFVRHWTTHWSLGGWPLIREHIQVLWLQFSAIGYPAGSLHRYEEDLEELFEALDCLKRVPQGGGGLGGNRNRISPTAAARTNASKGGGSSSSRLEVHWQKVRAHSNHHGNDVSDMLSKLGRRLPYDNAQLYNSLKLTLNLAPASHFAQRQLVERLESLELGQNLASKFTPQLLEVMAVPMHITQASVVARLPTGAAAFLCEKNMDFGAAKDVVLRCTQELYNACMEGRALRLDQHITCRVNPGIRQCSRCLAISDHLAKDCTSAVIRCGNCAARDHEWKACRKQTGTIEEGGAVCANCLDRGDVGDHSAFSSQCPLRQVEQERLASLALKKVALWKAEARKDKVEEGEEEEEGSKEGSTEDKENAGEKKPKKKKKKKSKSKADGEAEAEVEEGG